MAEELVFGAGFDPSTVAVMPAHELRHWYERAVKRQRDREARQGP